MPQQIRLQNTPILACFKVGYQYKKNYPVEGSVINQLIIVNRSQHTVSRAAINAGALKVLYGLKRAGYQACLVGGGVRDLLLNRRPKDFDVATDALPEQVKQIFPQCHLIGRRFRLAHVRVDQEIVEVATFRAHYETGSGGQTEATGRIIRDNVYGSLEEDAYRRDFTVNALYYSIHDFSIIDYVGGMADLNQRLLRLIGDAEQRYREDPVRMLRAVRFAAKLNFTLDSATAQMILPLGELLRDIPSARLYEEVLKLFLSGHAVASFEGLAEYGLLPRLFPHLASADTWPLKGLLLSALKQTDQRVTEDKSVSPAFLFAALLWQPVQEQLQLQVPSDSPQRALHEAIQAVLSEQQAYVSLPQRILRPMFDIWGLQSAFNTRKGGKKALRFLQHPSFRAAYDFLWLRIEMGSEDPALGEWWRKAQENQTEPGVVVVEKKPRRRRKKWTQT